MLKNYLTLTLRMLRKHPGYTAINVFGLAVGLACCLLISLYITHEFSYDRFHEKANRIYRLIVDNPTRAPDRAYVPIAAPFGPLFDEALPDIEAVVRFSRSPKASVSYRDKPFYEERLFYTDPSVFDVFSFRLLRGDSGTALNAPFTIVLTETTARTYFGPEDPLGKTLVVEEQPYTVTGILEDVPPNAHLRPGLLASFASLEQVWGMESIQHPGNNAFYTYLLLAPGRTPSEVTRRFPGLVEQAYGTLYGTGYADEHVFSLQPLTRIHLYSKRGGELEAPGSLTLLAIYAAVALFILLIAGINFVNLATARSSDRAREIGVRKVVGAHRRQIAGQYLCESVLLSAAAGVGGVLLVVEFLPAFNTLIGTSLTLAPLLWPTCGLGLLAIILGVGLLAGGYPALVLSSFRPALVLKGRFHTSTQGALLRKSLVVSQFTISTVLLVCTMIVTRQLDFLASTSLGFDREQVVVAPLTGDEAGRRVEALKQAWRQVPGVLRVTASSGLPGEGVASILFRVEQPGGEEEHTLRSLGVDYDFLETLGIELAAGRGFSEDFASDAARAFLVNETAARHLGWDDALGKRIVWPFRDTVVKEGEVIGVVQDFHFASLHQPIEPLVLHVTSGAPRYLSARLAPRDLRATLQQLGTTWRQFDAAHPFDSFFLDAHFDRLYQAEARFRAFFGYATLLTILVACLGLFGLVSFTVTQRTKEIGIRKVLGATVSQVVLLLTKDFVRLVALAFVVAVPVAYFPMHRWLEDFAYRIDISWQTFLIAGLTALGIALLTMSYQAIRAALADPVKALRYE